MNLQAIAAFVFLFCAVPGALAQDALQGLDTTSDAFTKAEMSRAEIEDALAKLAPDAVLDLTGKSLNGLDLSKMDLHRTILKQARLNKANLAGANLEGVALDQAWGIGADSSSTAPTSRAHTRQRISPTRAWSRRASTGPRSRPGSETRARW
jgi:hypothetical protein